MRYSEYVSLKQEINEAETLVDGVNSRDPEDVTRKALQKILDIVNELAALVARDSD